MRTPAQIHSPFPDFFTFSVGPLGEGDWWEVAYIANTLRYRTGNSSSVLPSREVLSTPDAAHWALFWQTLERIGVWDWNPDYTDPSMRGGEGWALEIRHAHHSIKTGGTNAYPGSDGPHFSSDTPFGQFLAAVEKLTSFTALTTQRIGKDLV